MAAIMPSMSSVSIETRPRAYADNIVSSAVKQPSAYAHPISPSECPIYPSGSISNAFNKSNNAI